MNQFLTKYFTLHHCTFYFKYLVASIMASYKAVLFVKFLTCDATRAQKNASLPLFNALSKKISSTICFHFWKPTVLDCSHNWHSFFRSLWIHYSIFSPDSEEC